jgi:hypothetical protein
MSKRTKIAQCVYCGEIREITRDHVISSNLFPNSYEKKNVIIAPSCLKCNKGYSLDEEYFRIFVCGAGLEHSQQAVDLSFSKVRRGIQRKPDIISDMYKRMDLVDLYTKGGIFIGKRTRIIISDKDWERYCNVLNKYIKGLFFHEFKRILPVEYTIHHSQGDLNMLQESKLISDMKWNIDHQEIFAYGYACALNTDYSIWLTIFYDSIFFLSCIATEDIFKMFNKSKT